MLDVGAGKGNVLARLKQLFGNRIQTHALVLKAVPELKEKKRIGQVDQITQGSIEAFLPKQEYDLILSYWGGIMYSYEPGVAIQKMAHALAKNGIGIVTPTGTAFKKRDTEFREAINALRTNHAFSVTEEENYIQIQRIR
ncbi:MAG: class I SAM-dependent methyltransferase [Candidatus Diapherotrites archaeon]|nr:class I SAM-dependent methyltransferase [Candidatus Diapherotrites archaeon]